MQWVLPKIPRSREPLGLFAEGRGAPEHVAGPSDFCRDCLADLRIARLRVLIVTYSDVWRLRLCRVAADALILSEPAALYECERLRISPMEQQWLLGILLEGLEPVHVYEMCGLEGVDLVGIAADGAFLYAKAGEWEIGPARVLARKASEAKVWHDNAHASYQQRRFSIGIFRRTGAPSASSTRSTEQENAALPFPEPTVRFRGTPGEGWTALTTCL